MTWLDKISQPPLRLRSIAFIESPLSYLSNTNATSDTLSVKSFIIFRSFRITTSPKSLNVWNWLSFNDCTIAIPSIMYRVLFDLLSVVGSWWTSSQFDSKHFTKSDLTVFLIEPSALNSDGDTAASSYWRTVLRSMSRCCDMAKSRRNKTSGSTSNLFSLSNGSAFFIFAKVKIVVFFCASLKLNSFLSSTKRSVKNFSRIFFRCL